MRRLATGETCDLCSRYVLPGEPIHLFEDPERGRRRRPVCALCHRRALARGWIRSTPSVALRREDAPAA
jgi:hypothetical protein